ncbi:hypothetical protein R0J91_10365 [Micrococcus sp. SIMBA_131]
MVHVTIGGLGAGVPNHVGRHRGIRENTRKSTVRPGLRAGCHP